ncbi:Mss4-like protein [Paraphoma chrysanthemicola]|nr:Mss4-like protein [Paraphoma chrysanthemicola]
MSEANASIESHTYPCRCHCGEVTFTIKLSPQMEVYTVMQCNCSICTANGYLLVYPKRSDVVFHGSSKDHVQKYQFHTKKKDHWFCRHCGTSLLIDFNGIYENYDVMAVNARTIENVDVSTLKLEYGDGRKL